MYRKLFIEPYFGDFPEWFDKYAANVSSLVPYGYDMLIETDLKKFEQRVGDKLGIKCSVEPGGRKVSDYRVAFGVMYEDEIKDYDFWGHTDFDCVYGRVDQFVTEDFLSSLDLHSNHRSYLCGPWSLYRNKEKVNNLFYENECWREQMENPNSLGWAEQEYSRHLDDEHNRGNLIRRYTHWQELNPMDDSGITMRDGHLYDNGTEIMMSHFRHLKRWPSGVQSCN